MTSLGTSARARGSQVRLMCIKARRSPVRPGVCQLVEHCILNDKSHLLVDIRAAEDSSLRVALHNLISNKFCRRPLKPLAETKGVICSKGDSMYSRHVVLEIINIVKNYLPGFSR
jgi:hypothetical protein